MSNKGCNAVPDSVTFGKKILTIPNLNEVGIPLAGVSLVQTNPKLKEYWAVGGCWVDRGDLLLTYEFRFFETLEPSFFSRFGRRDPIWVDKFEIRSPISGLIIFSRNEDSISTGLQYEWVKEYGALPIILVPNDEPLPDDRNFFSYNSMNKELLRSFDVIPMRRPQKIDPERMVTYLDDPYSKEKFEAYRRQLENRNPEDYTQYDIREITHEDKDLMRNIQNLRGKDILLREKLVHLSREFGESI